MSDLFKVELSRARAVAICVCAAIACVLLFVAGAASGILLASGAAAPQMARVAPAQLAYEPIPRAESAPTTNAKSASTSGSSAAQSGNPPSLAVLSTAPKAATPQPAPQAAPAAPAQPTAPAPAQPPVAPVNLNQPPAANSEAAASSDLIAAPPRNSEGNGLPLDVKVCSFSGKTSADNLASFLDSKGYHASVVRSFGAEDRIWYVVTVGPYSQWDSAANAAAHVAILANVQPVVGQLR